MVKKVLFMAGGVGGPGVPVRNGLVAEYKYNERGGLTLYDRSGNTHNGTLGSDPAGPDASDPTWTIAGAKFVDDYISCGSFVTTSADFTQISLLCVINADVLSDGDTILTKYVGTGNQRSWGLLVGGTSGFRVFVSKAGTAADKNYSTAAGVVATGTPSMIGFTINGNSLKLYKNSGELGSITKTTDNDTATIYQSSTPLKHAGTFRGTISYAVIYNRELGVSEIANIYNYLKSNLKLRGITLP